MRRLPAVLLLGLAVSCAVTDTPTAVASPAPSEALVVVDSLPWSAVPLEQISAVHDTATGEVLTLEELYARLATADAVFLGEQHTDESTHRAEAAVHAALLARRGNVVLAMEMFERDVQPQLDRYLAGEIDEAEFLAHARPWGNYKTGYRAMVEQSRAAGQPVIASNFPRPLRNVVMQEGLAGLEALEGEAARQSPAPIQANSKEYHRRVDNAVRGHLEMMRQHGAADDNGQRLTSTQTLWDNSMGGATARALDENPGSMVLHVNGGFHSEYRDGTVRQLLLRRPQTQVLTVAIVPTDAPHAASPTGVPEADFMLYVQRRATEDSEGMWAVRTGRDLRYRLHIPKSASADALAPLVIFLSDDGFSAQDGMDLIRATLGDDVAVIALEAPYRETQQDMSVGGRWFWADTFSSDLGTAGAGIQETWSYVVRNFPVDPQRTCVLGEGTGATMVAVSALFADEQPWRSLAIQPRHYEKLKDIPLPLPEYRTEDRAAGQSMTVLVDGDSAAAWWQAELDAYRGVDVDARLVQADGDVWQRVTQRTALIREALGLPAAEAMTGDERAAVTVAGDEVRAQLWARLAALQNQAATGQATAVIPIGTMQGDAIVIPTELTSADFTGDRKLPLCPGAFGGTTVLVLPADLSDEEVQAWLTIEENDPLQKRSRFHRLRIATAGGQRDLGIVLRELKDAGRKNVLIVPAAFHAGGDFMRALAAKARTHEEGMTLAWLPGLGGSL